MEEGEKEKKNKNNKNRFYVYVPSKKRKENRPSNAARGKREDGIRSALVSSSCSAPGKQSAESGTIFSTYSHEKHRFNF